MENAKKTTLSSDFNNDLNAQYATINVTPDQSTLSSKPKKSYHEITTEMYANRNRILNEEEIPEELVQELHDLIESGNVAELLNSFSNKSKSKPKQHSIISKLDRIRIPKNKKPKYQGKHLHQKGLKYYLNKFLKYLDKSSYLHEKKFKNPILEYTKLFFRKFKIFICFVLSLIIVFTIANKEEPLKKGKKNVALKPTFENTLSEEEQRQLKLFNSVKKEGYLILEENFSASSLVAFDTHGESVTEFSGDYENFYILRETKNTHDINGNIYYDYEDIFSSSGFLSVKEDLSLGIYNDSDSNVMVDSVCSYKDNAIKPLNDMLAKYGLNNLIKDNYKKEELEHILNALTKAQNTLFSNSTVTLEGEIDEAKILIMDTNSQSVNNTYGSHHEYYILVYNGEKNKYTASYIDILNSNAMVTIANNYSYGSYRDLKNASLIEFGLNENVSISAVKPLNTFFDELDLKDYIKAEYTLEELQDIINHINELKLQSIEKEERSYDAIIEPKIYVLSLKGDLNGQYSEDFSKYQFLSFNVKSTVVADKYVEIYSYDDLINHGAVVETFSNGFGNYTDKSKGVSFTFTFGDKASKILSIEDFLNNEGLSDLIKKSYTKRDLIEISNLLQDNLTRQRGN